MSLPFLKPEKMASIIVANRKKDGSIQTSHEQGEQKPELMSAAEDLIRAVHAKEASKVASALKAAFDLCDAEPHEEGEHV